MQLQSILAILPCALLANSGPIAAPQVGSASSSSPTGIPGDFPTDLIGGPGGIAPGDFSTILTGGPGGDLSGSFPTGPTEGLGEDLSKFLPTGPSGGLSGDLFGSFLTGPSGGLGGVSPGDLPTGLPALGGNTKRDLTETLDKRQQSLSSP